MCLKLDIKVLCIPVLCLSVCFPMTCLITSLNLQEWCHQVYIRECNHISLVWVIVVMREIMRTETIDVYKCENNMSVGLFDLSLT